MKILFCSQNPLVKELGAPKILMELAESLQEWGWDCKIASPQEIMPHKKYRKHSWLQLFSESLKNYLLKYAHKYDVVEYDQVYLPYPRAEFCAQTLFVSRVGLLANHLQDNQIPLAKSYKSRLYSLIMGRLDNLYCQRAMQYERITLNEADLINTVNNKFKTELAGWGIPEEKIVVFPCGISASRRKLFDAVSSEIPREPQVVFVGSFDNRKGATDLPKIFENIHHIIPEAKFKLLGTGAGRDERYVLPHFLRRLQDRIEVVPIFPSDALPGLLSSCAVGIFSSYADGFGFGVLEMLASSIPVIAYDVPGPATMLPPEYLVSPGDFEGLSLKAVELLKDKAKLRVARIWAKEQSQQFSWQQIAKDTSQIYLERWRKKQR